MKQKDNAKRSVMVRLDEKLYEQLKTAAISERRSTSQMGALFIERCIPEHPSRKLKTKAA